MSKVINITDRLTKDKPTIEIGEKSYPINDSMEVVFKFEELASSGNKGILQAMELAMGAKAFKELQIEKMSVKNFKVLTIALLASMQEISYEDAEARFQRQTGQQ